MAPQQHSSKGKQCYVYSHCRRLKLDLFIVVFHYCHVHSKTGFEGAGCWIIVLSQQTYSIAVKLVICLAVGLVIMVS